MKNIYFVLFGILFFASPQFGSAQDIPPSDTTGTLPYPFEDQPAFGFSKQDTQKLFLNKPDNIKYEVEYDPVTGQYVFYEKIGDLNYRLPQSMSLDDYIDYDFDRSVHEYWKTRTKLEDIDKRGGLLPELTIGSEAFNRIFGGNTINIQPQGYVEVSFGYEVNTTDNPSISESLRKVSTFDFDEEIQMSVTGQIGTKMNMRVNYNTEATFDYENKMNLEYTGDEDEIIQSIEAGNVSLPLNGTLITGASNLFGVKAEMQFGKLNVTTLFSQQKGETTTVETEGGAQVSTFEISAADYDANRHFFLSHYFREHYNEWLSNTAIPSSPITINSVEVWVTNKSSDTDGRNILAFQDLGEHDPYIDNDVSQFQETAGLAYPKNIYPNNDANGLYDAMTSTYSAVRDISDITTTMAQFGTSFVGGTDYEKVELARKLSDSEYEVNTTLGYITLSSALNSDEVLAVAFNFTSNGETYQVGEFTTDGLESTETLFVKLLKGTDLSPDKATWDLMMKNVYDLNAYQLSSDDFELNVMYLNDSTGTYINYLPDSRIEGHTLLQVMRLDMLNSQLDATQDGIFDFVDGVTIDASSGYVIFPVLEPFGTNLSDSIIDPTYIDKYVFQDLYDETQVEAEQDAEHNKFILSGSYEGSSSSSISLGSMNVTEGSVTVTANGVVLTENVDYVVDYTLGTVEIINEALLEADTPIEISSESEDLFSMQQTTLMGTYANYAISDNFNIGTTLLYMNEQSLTDKVDYGEDPVSNLMFGFDAQYSAESPFLTKALNALPFYSTKATSSISFEGEYAQLIPGSSGDIDNTVYIDDFESTKTSIDMRSLTSWALASTPQSQDDLFPEASLTGSLDYGMNRARLAFYNINTLFLRNTSLTPSHIKNDYDAQSSHFVREIYEQELFPDKEYETGEATNITTLDLAFYPSERGPYNFDTGTSSYAAGVNEDGSLRSPETRWGGIMREVQTTDFETANIEYIEFWVMDPFVYDTLNENSGGDLYINLGEISEDILKDSRKSYENGLPTTEVVEDVDTTVWGRVSTLQSLTSSFDNGTSSRQYQDIGFDGLNDEDEQSHFEEYLEELRLKVNDDAYQAALSDPATDNFHYYRGSDYDEQEVSILGRYKKYNGPDGNSPTSDMSTESYTTAATTIPDKEDINDDFTLNEYERYYQYKISIRKEDMELGKNYINDITTSKIELANGTTGEVDFYQFLIPLDSPDDSIGSISDFSSIRFMRMFLHGFSDSIIMRFATLDLVRSEWRNYTDDLSEDTESESANATLEISALSIEENGSREPVNYVLPPGVSRSIDATSTELLQLDEQSIVLDVTDLEQGDAKAAYKSMSMDFRNYEMLKLDVHAEELDDAMLEDDELYFFIRMGSDYTSNYYEYEIPLKITPAGTYDNDVEDDRYIVWPEENQIYIPLDIFTDLKLDRNDALNDSTSTTDIYEQQDMDRNSGKNYIKVKGSPNLGNIEVFMMGVHNRTGQVNTGPKSVEVWANELRLTGLDNDGGWAANMRLSARLADLGSVTIAGSKSTAGFGSIDDDVSSRQTEDVTSFDISTSIDWGRFFPEKAGVSIPMYYGYSKSTTTPEYNPLDPDIELDESLALLDTKEEKDSLKNMVQEVTERKSINFTNVRVEPQKQKEKSRLWDIDNFSATYAYNETSEKDVTTAVDLEKTHKLMFSYNYSSRPKLIQPFKNVKLFQKGPLKFIGDFNFYPLPSQISYRTNLYRYYHETQSRNITSPTLVLASTYDKEFLWNRYLDINYDLSKSLKLDFSSQSTSTIDEPEGRIDKDDDDYEWKRDSILYNLLHGGRPTLYSHDINLTYQVPLRNFKALNFMTANLSYSGNYDWDAGSLTDDDDTNIGNTVSNSNSISMSSNANMQTLFNKVPYFKEVTQKFKKNSRSSGRSSGRSSTQSSGRNSQQNSQAGQKKKEDTYSSNLRLKEGTRQKITHKLNTKKVKVLVTGVDGKAIPGKLDIIDANTIEFTPNITANQAMVTVSGKKGDQPFIKDMLDFTTRLAIGLKTLSLTYSTTGSTVLPGYLPEPSLFGAGNYSPDPQWSINNAPSGFAPGLPFLMGWQDRNFAVKAAEKGWITTDTTLNSPFMFNEYERIYLRALWEPLPDLTITLTGNRSFSRNTTEYYDYDVTTGSFDANSTTESGTFSMSTFTWKTAFFKIGDEKLLSSDAFEDMKDNRKIIAQRLANKRAKTGNYDAASSHASSAGYPEGYGPNSPEVMIPAFLAAYQGKDPEKVPLSFFPSVKYMRPNWTISYDGMVSQIPALKNVMRSLNIEHSYTSTYSIGSYSSNLSYSPESDGYSYVTDLSDNFVAAYDFTSLNLVESFNPLINVDVTWQSDFTTRAEINRTRNLNLSFTNNQITEVLSSEFVVGVGYRFTNMDMIIKTKNKQQAYSNDLNLRADISYTKSKTNLRQLDSDDDQITAGQGNFSLETYAEYALSDKFEMKVYYDHSLNDPYTSLSYRTTTSSFGVSFKFTLSN